MDTFHFNHVQETRTNVVWIVVFSLFTIVNSWSLKTLAQNARLDKSQRSLIIVPQEHKSKALVLTYLREGNPAVHHQSLKNVEVSQPIYLIEECSYSISSAISSNKSILSGCITLIEIALTNDYDDLIVHNDHLTLEKGKENFDPDGRFTSATVYRVVNLLFKGDLRSSLVAPPIAAIVHAFRSRPRFIRAKYEKLFKGLPKPNHRTVAYIDSERYTELVTLIKLKRKELDPYIDINRP